MNKLKSKLVKLLGGYTPEEVSDKLKGCEDWANTHLTAKDSAIKIIPDCLCYNPYDDEKLMLTRSNTRVWHGRIQSIIVAPWCKDIDIIACEIAKEEPERGILY